MCLCVIWDGWRALESYEASDRELAVDELSARDASAGVCAGFGATNSRELRSGRIGAEISARA